MKSKSYRARMLPEKLGARGSQAFWHTDTLKLLVDSSELGVEDTRSTREGEATRDCPHKVKIHAAGFSITNVLKEYQERYVGRVKARYLQICNVGLVEAGI